MFKGKSSSIVASLFVFFFALFSLASPQLASAGPLGEGSIEAYAWSVYSGVLAKGPVKHTIPEGEITLIKNDSMDSFMSGGDFVGNTWYAVSYTGDLFTIDCHTGDTTLIGATGLTKLTGFTYDLITETAYVSDENNLYTIDLLTAKVTSVGKISSDIIIGIAADGAGNFYALGIVSDQLFTVDKETGAGTAIGNIGFDVNGAQDIGFDRTSGILYGSLCVFGYPALGYSGGLYRFDLDTGAATPLKVFGSLIELDALAIPYADVKYTVVGEADPTAGGTIYGSGEYDGGTVATLTAAPAAGFEFVNWTEDGVEVSTEQSYRFVLFKDRNLVANFKMVVSGISLDPTSLTLSVDDVPFQLAATIFPEGAANKKVLWSSSDQSVALVDQDGLVSAVAVGQAVITAATEDGGFTATCTVTVTVPVSGISLNHTSRALAVGDAPFQLAAMIFPEGATNKKVLWTSSDQSVAQVDQDGLVSAVAAGQAVITAATEDGGFTATCTVTITLPEEKKELPRTGAGPYLYILFALAFLMVTGGCICLRPIK